MSMLRVRGPFCGGLLLALLMLGLLSLILLILLLLSVGASKLFSAGTALDVTVFSVNNGFVMPILLLLLLTL